MTKELLTTNGFKPLLQHMEIYYEKTIYWYYVLSTTAAFAQNYEVLYGVSLADSALLIEDYKSQGFEATRLNSNACSKTVSSQGQFCVVATEGENIEILYGASLADSALLIEDYKSQGFEATRLNSNACDKTVGSRGDFCVVVRK